MDARGVVMSYLDSFSSGDPERVAAHVTADFENRQVGALGSGCRGADVYRERLGEFLEQFRNLQYRVEDIVVEGHKVAAAYRMTFDHGEAPIEIQGMMLFTVRDGLIAERSDYWDGVTYLRAAGIEA